MIRLRSSAFGVVVSLCTLAGLAACGGDEKGGAGKASPSPAAPSNGYESPLALLKALSLAVHSGDEAAVRALCDPSGPGASIRSDMWAALARSCAAWDAARKAYVAKFGQAAWDQAGNPIAEGWRLRDWALAPALEGEPVPQVETKGDEAEVRALKFVFTVLRRDGGWRLFREATFGREGDLKAVEADAARAASAAAIVRESATPADASSRFEAR